MDQITIIFEHDIYPDKQPAEDIQYSDRLTGKAIVFDASNKIALVGNNQNNFLLLPGGGIDAREGIRTGIVRECLEEIGCKVNLLEEVGRIDDYRPRDKKHCINYCYTARLIGEIGQTSLTKDEAGIGMYTKWVTLNEALEIFKKQKKDLISGKVDFYNTGFNIARDLIFLEYAMCAN